MADAATIRTLVQELVATFDSTIDTSQGSTFDSSVTVPLITRLGGSPLDVDLKTFLQTRLREEFPEIDVSDLSGITDLLIKPAVVLLDPIRREITGVKVSSSLNDADSMTREEVDALLGNFFTSLSAGSRATGVVRTFFTAPRSVAVTPNTRFATGSGLNFYPTAVQSISQQLMAFNLSGTLYFFDVTVQAEEVGTEYNVSAGDINSAPSIVGVVRVENLTDFDDATQPETKAEGIARAQESITIRNLSVQRGIEFVLSERFSFLSTIQVIGKGDVEMRRDVVSGPASVSDIPGGIIGDLPPDVTAGNEIHIGGKTDVYLYQRSLVSDTLDFENLTDRGVQIYAGNEGFTQAGPDTVTFEDTRGNFSVRGILPGDVLRVSTFERTVDTVGSTSLTLTATLPGGIFGQDYEVVRKTSGLIQVPLYDLVAEASGAAVFDTDGDPIQPVPGDRDLAALSDTGGTLVKKTENIASNNVQLPLIRLSGVEFLDPLTLESSGVEIPQKDVVLVTNEAAFTGGTPLERATGTVRIFFREAVSAYTTAALTLLNVGTVSFRPIAEVVGTARADATGFTILLEGVDYTTTISQGDRISTNGTIYTVTAAPVFDLTNTQITVREEITATFSSEAFTAHQGTLQSGMQQDASTLLYFLDVSVESVLTGTQGNIAADQIFEFQNVNSEGWSLKTTKAVLSFSTRELAYVELSDFVNDTTDLTDAGTAYALRLNYEYASSLPQVQTFVEDPVNRVVGEDLLVRHFLPAYVQGAIEVRGLTEATARTTLETFLLDLDPTFELELSDVVDKLYEAGATKVTMPYTLTALAQDASRTWTATVSQDSLGSSRVQHFLPGDASEILFTILA